LALDESGSADLGRTEISRPTRDADTPLVEIRPAARAIPAGGPPPGGDGEQGPSGGEPGTDGEQSTSEEQSTSGEQSAEGEPGQPARTRRTGRNLPIAFAVALGLGAFVVLTLFTVKSTFLIFMGAAVALALVELSRVLRAREMTLPLIPLYLVGTALWTCAYWLGAQAGLAALGLTVIGILAWRLPGGAAGYLRDVLSGLFALCYLPLIGSFVALMLAMPGGAWRTFLFIVVTVCSDIGGYFAGIAFGKHPLVPTISPKKTWEGLAGSVLACLAAGGILLPVLLGGHVWQGLLLGAAVVTAATLGDLVESMIKRDLGIKDMGSFLPGHGGILDRIDSLVMSAPVTWLLLLVFVKP
jgi:phosphatidate cytidylyltransferase